MQFFLAITHFFARINILVCCGCCGGFMQIYTSLLFLFFHILFTRKKNTAKRDYGIESFESCSFLSNKLIFPATYHNHIKDKAIL